MHIPLTNIFNCNSLNDIIGQDTEALGVMLKNPVSSCWLLHGKPGTGKTATARAVAKTLGCEDDWSGLHHFPCSNFGIDDAKQLFGRNLRMASTSKSRFHCVILEECEWLSPQVQRYLKDALDPVTNLPSRCIVVGTSNSLANLDEALVERFRCIEYRADQEFATLCRSKILNLINTVMEPAYRAGLSRPPIVSQWGQKGDRFSMREAIKNAEDFLRTENTRVSNLAQRR